MEIFPFRDLIDLPLMLVARNSSWAGEA